MNKNLNKPAFVITLTALLFSALLASGKPIEDRKEHEFQASPGDKLIVSVRDADIKIRGEKDRRTVSIVVTKTVKNMDEAEAQEAFDLYTIECTQEQELVRIESIRPDQSLVDKFRRLNRNLSIRIEVVLPEESEILAKTSDGDIDLATITGNTELKTSDGDVSLVRINGSVSAKSSDGDVDVEQVTGEVHATTSDGNLTITGVIGNLDVKTSDGDITVTDLNGSLNAQTSDGNISANLANTPPSDCRMRTSDGDISLTLSDEVSADLHIRVSDGDIRVNHPAAKITQLTKRSANVRLGEGSIQIQMSTSDGNITVGN
jgi:DUF4097 and DUF4098 domain-containing protein YvlB